MADRTSSTLVIGAPRALLMRVISDFTTYPQWASGVRSAEVLGTGADGLPAEVRFTIDAGLIKDTYALRYTWLAADGVSWELSEKGKMVSEMTGAYRLAERPAAGGAETEVTYELAVGLAVPMIGPLKRRAEKTIIDTALKGLRDRALSLPDPGAAR